MRKAIDGWVDLYEIDTDGNVYDVRKKRTLKPRVAKNRYLEYTFYRRRGSWHGQVHRLVAKTFCKDYFEGCDVHHIDGNRYNNNVSNLMCLTRAQHDKIHNIVR